MSAPQPELSEEQLAELERLLAKCVPQNIDTAQYIDAGHYECPLCAAEGYVDGSTYTNYDGQANGVQFFGIGHAHKDAEALFRKTIASLPALLAMARRSVPGDVRVKALEEAAKVADQVAHDACAAMQEGDTRTVLHTTIANAAADIAGQIRLLSPPQGSVSS